MKKKALKILVILISVLLTGGLGAGIWFVVRPWPKADGTEVISGISEPVKIVRDEWGIPHIYAQNEHDLLFAQGYVHAQDRLWQMDFNRHLASGRMSMILGSLSLESDKHMRTLGLHRAAQKEWERLTEENRQLLSAYAAGVNAYINSHLHKLPLEYTFLQIRPSPWEPLDSLVIGRMYSANFTWNYPLEMLRLSLINRFGLEKTEELMPPYRKGGIIDTLGEDFEISGQKLSRFLSLVATLKGSSHMQGSNNWAVHGAHTTTGLPFLANDTHLPFSMPSVWYENGLHGGRFNNIGFIFPGIPLVLTGHNQHVGWSITDLPADIEDVYLEKLNDAENPTQYQYNGSWHDLEIIEETIEVNGQAAETIPVYITRHGPILDTHIFVDLQAYRAQNKGLALRSVVNDSNIFKGLVLINLAQNCDEFRQALAAWEFPCEHFIFADTEGNIGYQAAGKFPVRQPGHQGLLPVPGWTGEYEWQGFYEFAEVYGVLNPAQGYYATANDQGFPADYSLPLIYGLDWSVCRTVDLISGFLNSKPQHSFQDMQELQASTYSVVAESFLPYLLSVQPQSELQEQALAFLNEWDLRMEKDRVGAALFNMWFWFFLENIFQDDLGAESMQDFQIFNRLPLPLLDLIMPERDNPWFDNLDTAGPESRDDIVLKSLEETIDWLTTRCGPRPEKWTWGNIHKLTFVHQPFGYSGIAPLERLFNSRPVPVRGSQYTVNNASPATDGSFTVEMGSSQRFILDFSDWDNSIAVNSTGQSAHLFHPHRDDMISMWEKVEYHPMLFTPEAVETHGKSFLLLNPGKTSQESD